MTPLRQRFAGDMLLRGLAPTTQRSYIHYVADFAQYYNTSRKSAPWTPCGKTTCTCSMTEGCRRSQSTVFLPSIAPAGLIPRA